MKYLVRITETAVKTHEATIEAASKEAAEAKVVDQVNQTVSKSWDSVSVEFQVVKQLDGPWCEIDYSCLIVGAMVRLVPRFGHHFSKDEYEMLQLRVLKMFQQHSAHGPFSVAFRFNRPLTDAEVAVLTAPPRTKSVSDVLAGAKV